MNAENGSRWTREQMIVTVGMLLYGCQSEPSCDGTECTAAAYTYLKDGVCGP